MGGKGLGIRDLEMGLGAQDKGRGTENDGPAMELRDKGAGIGDL